MRYYLIHDLQLAADSRRALGAIVALWDICRKALTEPVWRLLGGAKQPHLRPYASLLRDGATLEGYTRSLVDKALQAHGDPRLLWILACLPPP